MSYFPHSSNPAYTKQMAASKVVSFVSLNPRISRRRTSLFNRERTFGVQMHTALPCSCFYHPGVLPLSASNSQRQCKATNFSESIGLSLKRGMLAPSGHASHSYLLKSCQVKSEDSEGTLTGENIILNEQTLEQELRIAIQEENYSKAAKIRDSLRSLQNDNRTSVLAANARFYNAFRNGDLAAMQALWSKGDNVAVVHPGVSGISGYDLAMGSWEFVWADYEFPLEIEIKDVQVHVRGDVGYVTCVEMVKTKGRSWGKQFATNVFEKIDGHWHICIHHASYIDL